MVNAVVIRENHDVCVSGSLAWAWNELVISSGEIEMACNYNGDRDLGDNPFP